MKKNLIIATLAAWACLATACGKEDMTAPNPTSPDMAAQNQDQLNHEAEEMAIAINDADINPGIIQFVETHFPQAAIDYCRATQHYYKVWLNDGTKVKFTHAINWVEVDCEHSGIYGSVPASIVPEQINAYVTANFPNNHIDQIEKKNSGNWEIELNNDHEIKFDTNFNVISGGNGGGGNSNFPEINTFVSTYFPLTSIQSARQDGNEIEVKLADGTDIDFYLNFDWQSIDCEDSHVYNSVPTELVPQQITAYVSANFTGKLIEAIEKKNNGGWEIELCNGLEICFDDNFNIIEIDDKK